MARTDGVWEVGTGGTYILPTGDPAGYDILVAGSNHYINFGAMVGVNGYGFRDNGGVIQFKNSGGTWQNIGSGSGGGGITSINGDATLAQILNVGTSGTDFNIADNGTGTHTFNLPTASATNRGLLSTTDWSTFNNKLSTTTAASTYVPYTGATGNVDLGTHTIAANTFYSANSTGGFSVEGAGGAINLLNESGYTGIIGVTGGAGISFKPAGSAPGVVNGWWYMSAIAGATQGGFLAAMDNTYDIGASGANRPRNLFIANSLTVASLSGVLKASSGLVSVATAGTDYQIPITLTTTGTSGAATFSGGTLNIPQYSGGGTPGGLNAQIQYNNAGVFGGISGATTNGTIVSLTNPLIGGATLTTSTVNGVTLTTGGGTTTFLNANGTYSTPAGAGTVTSVNVITANGVSATGGPITGSGSFTFSLGAITPTSVNGITLSGSGSIANSGTSSLTGFTGSGTTSGTNSGDQTITLTGDVTGTGTGSFATILATVNTNTGSWGTATQVAQFTVNGKGLITAAANVTLTPAIGSITGLGTGVATFLATPTSANLAAAVTDETGSGPLVFGTSPSLTGATLDTTTVGVTQTAGDSSTKLATTAFVANAILGQDFKEAAKYATTGALPSIVYNNGSSGVGATLTGVAFGVISIDSSTPSVGDRLLVKNQVSTFQNGIYVVTVVGTVGTVFVLTRSTDFNQSAQIDTGDSVFVSSGSTLSTTTWAYNGIDAPTMGTTAITFAQTSGQGSFTAGNGIAITGVSIAIDTSITVDKTTAQSLSNKNLTSGTNTFPTFNQNTTGSAATLTTPRTIGITTGDATSAGSTFDGSANNTNALTLATVNTNVGSFGSSTSIPSFTVNAKGLITAASGNAVIAPAGTLTGTTLNSTVTASSLTTVGTLASLTVTGNITNSALTASKPVFTDASKNLTSTGIGTSAQFIKADGSLDSSTYLTANQSITLSGHVTGSGTIAITTSSASKFILQGTADTTVSAAQFLGALGTGIVKNTTTTGVLSIATDGTDYLSPTTGITVSQGTGQTLGTTTNRLTKLWATDITVTNAIAGSITGNAATVTTNANLSGVVTSSGNTTSFGTFTSATLAAALSDETGTGVAVFSISPTFTTSILAAASTANIGSTTTGWAHLYMTTGGVLDFGNGNVVLTHTSGILSMGTGELRITTVGTNTASVLTLGSTSTITSKRITRRFVAVTQAAAPAIATDNTDIASITGLAQAVTSFTTNLTGTPVAGDYLMVQITDNGTARALAWGAKFTATTIALPTTTVATKLLRVGFQWDTVTGAWNCIAVA